MSKKTKIEPRNDYVVVELDSEESKVSEFGIITPDNVESEQKSTGTVIAVGFGDKVKDIQIGERVIFGTFSGDDLEMNGVKYKLVDQEFILGVIKK